MSELVPDLAPVVSQAGWWDNPLARREFARRWDRIPRRQEDPGPVPAPPGLRACPVPSVARHILQEGHLFTSDGRCWVPEA